MGELAVGAVDLAPLLGQVQDLLDLLIEQPVDRAATSGPVGQRAGRPPGLPTVDPPLGDCSTRQAACTVNPSATARSTSPSSACLVAAATRGGRRRSTPTRFSPQQHQLDRLLLDRLAQPLDLRPGRGQLGVLAGLAHARLGGRQRLQRALLAT